VTLIEFLIALAIIGMFVAWTIPQFNAFRRANASRTAAAGVRAALQLARQRAVARSRNVGLKFVKAGDDWTFAMYDDMDGDGVRNDDIIAGTDVLVAGPTRILPPRSLSRVGLPATAVRDPDSGSVMSPTAAGVQFGVAAICSFSATGEATAGTLYITDDSGDMFAVRVYGATGRVRTIRWNGGSQKWDSR
jgi:prepilin-type N-terminal cleavage/methylation domain-containing protein